jgi:hypothetical protein
MNSKTLDSKILFDFSGMTKGASIGTGTGALRTVEFWMIQQVRQLFRMAFDLVFFPITQCFTHR